ncbi:winged helix-turn-helix transcriptional regulator [Shewanella avicenniae]|uniref:Winged helix-turn-helix transcriptional regulator n=1 Tax=Shewanella avicenniae TaxID=2814294 RepID=A0ABX7QWJ5_9GAMM|nr:winged helix-turn-helix domain-containing protein [Shewanella avicenniae]QSX35203.1 winged helix-turn-helix transcriptional regulator [Shewanella avicenniae]
MNFLVVTDDEQWQQAVTPWIASKTENTPHRFALHSLKEQHLKPQLTPDVLVMLSRHFKKPAEHQQLACYTQLPCIFTSPESIDADIAPILVDESDSSEIVIDPKNGAIILQNRIVQLTDTELKIFQYLYEQQGQAVSKPELQQQILQRDFGQYDRNLDMHIANIRKKLQQAGLARNLILTVRGRGYSFNHEHLQFAQPDPVSNV